MDIAQFTHDPLILAGISRLQRQSRTYSDIIDDQGLQYVDMVMEGGGMLGIALVGYTWVLEQVGIRFLGVGGTSAGSINALLLSALGAPADAKSPKLLNELVGMNFWEFVDGDSDARDFVKAWVGGAGKFKLAFKGAQVIDNLTECLGLNPGQRFEQWLMSLLARENIFTLADLFRRMHTLPPGLRQRDGTRLSTPDDAGVRLAVVAADVSTETKAVFPDHADLYFADPLQVNPARFVRASMSIPYFFEPLILRDLPQGEAAIMRWKRVGFDARKEDGGVPDSALFVDGGVMSNFPIDVFHQSAGVPAAPTFGVKLEYDNRRRQIDGPLGLLGAIFNSARHCLDYDFLHRNPDYRHLVQWIPCQGYNWLDFDMSLQNKIGLFREGAIKAIEFLEAFDWAAYKQVRARLAGVPGG